MGDHLGTPDAIGIPNSGVNSAPFPYSVLSVVMDRNSESEESDVEMPEALNLSTTGILDIDSDSDESCEDLVLAHKSNEAKSKTEIYTDSDSDDSSEDGKESEESKSSEMQDTNLRTDGSQKSELSSTSSSDRSGKKRKVYKCDRPNCESVFYKPGHLYDHLNVHDDKRTYICNEKDCKKSYFKWNNLRRHLIDHHRISVDKRTYVRSELPPRVKEEKPQKMHACPYEGCGAEFARPWRLTAHLCRHTGEKPYKCKVPGCGRAYTMAGHLQRHIVESHEPRPPIVKEFKCSEVGCMKVYKTLESVKRHHKIYHSEDPPRTHPHKCSYCYRRFTTLNRLLGHEFTHTNIAPFKCLECPKSFTDISLWKRHCRSHKKERAFTCPVPGCGEVFPNFDVFKEHRRNAHVLTTSCPSCDRKFNSKSALNVHMQTHLKLHERNLFVCPYEDCPRFYTKKSNLDQHVRVAHEGKKLPCPFPGCGRKLVTKQKLQEHLKLHDPNRPVPERKCTVRRQRKDAGLNKRAMAVRMSGVEVPYQVEKELLEMNRRLLELTNDRRDDASSLESDGEESGGICDNEYSERDSLGMTVDEEQTEPLNFAKRESSVQFPKSIGKPTIAETSNVPNNISDRLRPVEEPTNVEVSAVLSDICVGGKPGEDTINTGESNAVSNASDV